MIVDCLFEATSNNWSYVDTPESTYCVGASTLGSGFMLDCFHVQGQARNNRDKFHTLAITGAKVVQLSFHTQYRMPSDPEAVFLILESANSTSCSLNLGGGRVSQSMTSGAGLL